MTKRFGVPEARQDMGNSSSAAFTLAEVLITLGIIGVVAAMTIPTLISNTNGAQFKTAYKKALSVLNQAAVMNVALEDSDFTTIKADADGAAPAAGSMGEIMINRTMGTYSKDLYKGSDVVKFTFAEDGVLKGGAESANAITADNIHSIEFPDGTVFSYNNAIKDCVQTENKNESSCIGFIDANGKKGPNTEITCSNDSKANRADGDCYVDNGKITDIYPVYIYGQQIVPASDAARAVLFGNDKAATTTSASGG